jgi:uncharacterized protein
MTEASPDAVTDPVGTLVAFGRALRARGMPVGTGRILTFCRAVRALSPVDRADLYWAAHACLVGRVEDIEAFDETFGAFFGGALGSWPEGIPQPWSDALDREGPELDAADAAAPPAGMTAARWRAASDEEPEGSASLRLVASAAEILREKSFAEMNDDERRQTTRLIRELAVRLPSRPSRRLRPARRGSRFDVARTLRRSLRTHGEPFHRTWRAPGRRSRPLLLILDVSGSMAPYSRAMLQFAFAAMAAGRRVEVFCFGTRLTRVTRTLRTRDPDRALREIGRRVGDWEGGTRIGASLRELLDGWGQRAGVRGAVVVVCSDGLERGDPGALAAQMARLRRLSHRVVWVNPLKGSPRYEPLARGMAAALPSVDVFLPGHNLESLEELGRVLA